MKISKRIATLLLIADVLVLGLIFSVSGLYNANVDTSDYVAQIEHFMHRDQSASDQIRFREFKPLYGFLGSFIAPYIGTYNTILFFNVLFFFGLSLSFFIFLRLLEFGEISSLVGTLWLITGYPLLKYGLSLGTDISGWFFASLTAMLGLYAFKRGSYSLLVFTSTLSFVGLLAKEPGVLGLGFLGLFLLFQAGDIPWRLLFYRLIALGGPFILLYGIQHFYLSATGVSSFWDWYFALKPKFEDTQTLSYFVGVEVASFHLLLLLSLTGVIFALYSGDIFKRLWVSKYGALFGASLPELLWPIYISRILYIQFLFFIPLALYGLDKILSGYKREENRKIMALIFSALPIVLSVSLFLVARNRSLFDVLSLL